MSSPAVVSSPLPRSASAEARRIVHRTRGVAHGPIVRLVSPSELGERIKPFVFLDYFDVDTNSAPEFGFHPHSGIATLTLLLDGSMTYEDSTGAKGTMDRGSVEWMQSGGGVWHTGKGTGDRIRGFQLWLALPPDLENGAASSRYLGPDSFAHDGPARVILGQHGRAHSPIEAPASINYLDVRLTAGEVWRYHPPEGHEVAWMAAYEGKVLVPEAVAAGELAVFAEAQTSITFRAQGDASFIVGSAAKHPHDLVLGRHSVHTHGEALRRGQSNIRRIGEVLRRAGQL